MDINSRCPGHARVDSRTCSVFRERSRKPRKVQPDGGHNMVKVMLSKPGLLVGQTGWKVTCHVRGTGEGIPVDLDRHARLEKLQTCLRREFHHCLVVTPCSPIDTCYLCERRARVRITRWLRGWYSSGSQVIQTTEPLCFCLFQEVHGALWCLFWMGLLTDLLYLQ